MRYIDAMQMNVSKLQVAIQEQPMGPTFLLHEFLKCQRWVGQYRQTRVEVLGEQ